MKKIDSLNELETLLSSNEIVWLLLYKTGSTQSECAIANLIEAGNKTDRNNDLYTADVSKVTDIHPAYEVTSVPALLHFENGRLRNVIKGCHSTGHYLSILNQLRANFTFSDKNTGFKRVIVYTTPSCTWCNTIKRHFIEHGINYHEIDVSSDQKAAEEMVRRSGRQGVPQTEINGEVIVGFDKTRINKLLGIN